MSSKLQSLHLKAIDKAIELESNFGIPNIHCLNIANKCSNITEDIAIKFANWLKDNLYNWEEIADPQPYNNQNPLSTEELFNKFIETL